MVRLSTARQLRNKNGRGGPQVAKSGPRLVRRANGGEGAADAGQSHSGLTGAECGEFVQMKPGTRVLILTVREDAAVEFREIVKGTDGTESRHLGAAEFIKEVRDAAPARGESGQAEGRDVLSSDSLGKRLSSRETEVLELFVRGESYKEIMDKLKLSFSSVRTYVNRLYRKLGVQTRWQAVARYHEGAVTSES